MGSNVAQASIQRPSETILLGDSDYTHAGTGGAHLNPYKLNHDPTYNQISIPDERHLDTFNMVYVDGHAKSQKLENWLVEGVSKSPFEVTMTSSDCPKPNYAKWDPVCPG